jgi:type I restriction enzyme M protein
VSSRISQQQLESYLWGAATLLRGTIDAGDYKQFIFPLLFYKRLCDVFDEETQTALKESGGDKAFAAYPENHRFQIPSEAHWRNVRQAAKNVGKALQSAMRTIETANPDKLYGIFGDAQWTNKDRLSDVLLRDLVEHFSTLELAVANLPEDELGQGYEYLIKKFADDAGHTAAEFYTNRTVVHLMTEILKPQPSESIYDPTCGSGGMLLSCITQLRRQGQEWRNVRLYGQERNLMTSSIARMNCFLHGIEDFQIVRGDTLSEPKFVQRDRLMRFDVVLANPPYSIKQWDRDAFASDPWGRNLFGTPPQGRADYAFWQHILCSLAPKSGRCAILFPHGVLFRQEEQEMRRKLIETDAVECVIGLGPNLFYNAAMEACVVICRTSKPKARKGRILFINAVNEVTRERAQSFLTEDHIAHIADAYDSFKDQPGLAKVTVLEEIRKNGHSLKIDLYVATPCASNGNGVASKQETEFAAALAAWSHSRMEVRDALSSVLPDLKRAGHRADTLKLAALTDIRRQFDQRKWTRVRFGDVVKFLRDSVDPNSGELDRYVAGDHMDTENVHIRRWGTVGDGYLGPAFVRRFRKGQVLYGSRRTYLKKVAYAKFDGITANTTFVLEGVKEKLHQPLLPWLMLSQRFTEHSVRESKGSTNPYINFPDIAKFEFDLPPLDQQRRMAEVFWGLDDGLQAWLETVHAAVEQRQSIVTEFIISHESDMGTLGDCLEEVQYGSSSKAILQPEPHLLPLLRIPNVIGGEVDFGELQWLEPAEEFQKYRLISGDVLIVRTNGNPDYVGRTAMYEGSEFSECLFASYLIRLRPKRDKLLPRFLHEMLQSGRVKKDIRKQVKSSAGNYNLNTQGIRGLRIPLPKTDTQQELLGRLASVDAVIESATGRAETTRTLRSAFLNHNAFNMDTL